MKDYFLRFFNRMTIKIITPIKKGNIKATACIMPFIRYGSRYKGVILLLLLCFSLLSQTLGIHASNTDDIYSSSNGGTFGGGGSSREQPFFDNSWSNEQKLWYFENYGFSIIQGITGKPMSDTFKKNLKDLWVVKDGRGSYEDWLNGQLKSDDKGGVTISPELMGLINDVNNESTEEEDDDNDNITQWTIGVRPISELIESLSTNDSFTNYEYYNAVRFRLLELSRDYFIYDVKTSSILSTGGFSVYNSECDDFVPPSLVSGHEYDSDYIGGIMLFLIPKKDVDCFVATFSDRYKYSYCSFCAPYSNWSPIKEGCTRVFIDNVNFDLFYIDSPYSFTSTYYSNEYTVDNLSKEIIEENNVFRSLYALYTNYESSYTCFASVADMKHYFTAKDNAYSA